MSKTTENCIYKGRVMHMRLQPVQHQFRYRVFSLFLDVDDIAATVRPLKLLGYNRFGLMSFHDADHGARDGSGLRGWIDEEHRKRGMACPEKAFVLAFPRILGFVFNPLTVYYCYDRSGALSSVLYEVKNTFGDQTAYLLRCDPSQDANSHSQKKMMYVSPFVELDQTYRFRLARPSDRLGLRIKQSGKDGETLISSLNGDRRKLSDRQLAWMLLSHPLMTIKVVAAIHWEALRLAIKGVHFRRYSKTTVFANENSQP